jgi:bacteriophage protein of unknown function (DUF646)|nr:MAG TPA: putative tail component [Caudoviricetes sp.]
MTLEERYKQLQKLSPELEKRISGAARDATLRAIEKATELTPPTQGDMRGTNTRSGEMKQHWATDSDPTPKRSGDTLKTVLANDKQYASYVNDGHRMDRHFVPGLYVNPSSGMLEYDPSKNVGIVVGTKTQYVPGLYMADAAKKVYQETVKAELDKIPEVFK